MRLKTGKVLNEISYLSPRPQPKITLRHDHDWTKGNDRSGSTVEQPPVGKLVQQSFGDEPRVKLSKPTQSKPKPISCFVDKGKRPVHTRLMINVCTKTCFFRWIGKPEKLYEDIRVEHVHDGTREPVKSSASTHIVKQQLVPEEHRDMASFNADNEFNCAIDEKNIDFDIPGVPNSTVKRSHDVNVQNLIQKIENHPQRQTLQNDLQQHRQFNLFSKNSQDVIKAAGNTELCELLDVEPTAQRKACLAHWDADIVQCTCGHFLRDDTTENMKYIKSFLDLFSIPHYYIRKGRPHGNKKGDKNITLRINLKRSARKDNF